MNEWMNEWMNGIVKGWINEWIHEWDSEQVKGWMSDWVNERANESTRYIRLILAWHLHDIHFPHFYCQCRNNEDMYSKCRGGYLVSNSTLGECSDIFLWRSDGYWRLSSVYVFELLNSNNTNNNNNNNIQHENKKAPPHSGWLLSK